MVPPLVPCPPYGRLVNWERTKPEGLRAVGWVEILPREAQAAEAGDGRSTDARLGIGWLGWRVALPAREAGLAVGTSDLE
jgi:hypothetical protein